MKTTRTIWMLAVALAWGTPPAWAARLRVHDMAESPQYGRKLFGMLGRGVLNVVTSPVDVIVNAVNETKAGPPLVGTLTGLGKGLGCGVIRLGSGAVDVVTSWVPGFNGFPVSDSYENCLAPAGSSAAMEDAMPAGDPGLESSWHVPTAEPGAAQAAEPAPKKRWKK
jgi:putative exosortase-associated protein (TIGR04073 family)